MSESTDDLARELRPQRMISMLLASLPGLALQVAALMYYAGSITTQLSVAQRDIAALQVTAASLQAELARTREELARERGDRERRDRRQDARSRAQ